MDSSPSTISLTWMACFSSSMCCLSAVMYRMPVSGSVRFTGNFCHTLLLNTSTPLRSRSARAHSTVTTCRLDSRKHSNFTSTLLVTPPEATQYSNLQGGSKHKKLNTSTPLQSRSARAHSTVTTRRLDSRKHSNFTSTLLVTPPEATQYNNLQGG